MSHSVFSFSCSIAYTGDDNYTHTMYRYYVYLLNTCIYYAYLHVQYTHTVHS